MLLTENVTSGYSSVFPPRGPLEPNTGRYHSLDVFRGAACLGVILFHAAGRDGTPGGSFILTTLGKVAELGWIGVPIFFVISGYCIAASASRPQRLRSYFLRRLRRIFPTLWIFLALTAAVVWLAAAIGVWEPLFGHRFGGGGGFSTIAVPTDLTAWQLVGSSTLTGWFADFRPLRHFGPWWMGHLWTLGYEEQFYVVVGLLLLLLKRHWWRGVEVLSIAVAVLVVLDPEAPYTRGLFIDGHWLTFALGLLVFHHLNVAHGPRRWVLPIAILVSLAALAPFQPPLAQVDEGHLPSHLLTGSLFAGALLLLHRWDLPVATARVMQPLAWCGRRCYSVYLLHWPITKMVTGLAMVLGLTGQMSTWFIVVPVAVCASLLAAWPFHRYVERRFMTR